MIYSLASLAHSATIQVCQHSSNLVLVQGSILHVPGHPPQHLLHPLANILPPGSLVCLHSLLPIQSSILTQRATTRFQTWLAPNTNWLYARLVSLSWSIYLVTSLVWLLTLYQASHSEQRL